MTERIYAAPAELRAQPDMQGDIHDSVLTLLLTAASAAIDGFCNRQRDGFQAESTASERIYPGSGENYQWIHECVEIVSVEVKTSPSSESYVLWPSSDWMGFTGEPTYPDFNGPRFDGIMSVSSKKFTLGELGGSEFSNGSITKVPTVKVTAKWGYSLELPSLIKQATILQASRWFKRGQAFWSDATANADLGMMMYRKDLDPDLKMMLVNGRMVRPIYGSGQS